MLTFLALLIIGNMPMLLAAVMASPTYSIQFDSVNTGGGRGVSSNYFGESTVGEVGTGDSQSATYKLKAGYQQMNNVFLSFTTLASDVLMTPSLGGITGGVSNGTTTVVVTTDSPAGYTMTIQASSSPAMQGDTTTDSIADYTPAVSGIPDFAYAVPGDPEFGYTVSASTTADLAQKFLDNSSACNVGSLDTNGSASCWYGLSTTATSTIVRNTRTPVSGSTSSVVFKLQINSGSFVLADTYSATTTLTAVSN